jgi:3-hydroxyacyl-[acyl-carrier-protein] dehydratase
MRSSAAAGFEILDWRPVDDGWSCEVRVDSRHACFEGHFPGEAILPGIAQLQLILAAAERESGAPQNLTALHAFRCRRPIRPGQLLQVRARRVEGRRLRFELRDASGRYSDGVAELEEAGS